MNKFNVLVSKVVVLPINNIDTDQIIPARFLKAVDKNGLGKNLFSDLRYDTVGNPIPEFPLNRPENAGSRVLLAGNNFGSGSSREHAPWALMDWGIKAVIALGFADIFRNNALKNGLLPIEIAARDHNELLQRLTQNSGTELKIDLPNQSVVMEGFTASFPIDPFSKTCLLEGVDELGYLLNHEEKIHKYETVNNYW
jgi:3-isopropylmalate/(R)-2-methylmalate dehydratase small subunit